MNRPPDTTSASRQLPPRARPSSADRPPLAALSIRFDDGHRVEIHCHSHPDGILTVQTTTRPADTPDPAGSAEVIRLTRARFLTTTGRRGAAVGGIYTRGRTDFDDAVTVANTLDLLGSATLAAVGITDLQDARAILAELWSTR